VGYSREVLLRDDKKEERKGKKEGKEKKVLKIVATQRGSGGREAAKSTRQKEAGGRE